MCAVNACHETLSPVPGLSMRRHLERFVQFLANGMLFIAIAVFGIGGMLFIAIAVLRICAQIQAECFKSQHDAVCAETCGFLDYEPEVGHLHVNHTIVCECLTNCGLIEIVSQEPVRQ